MKMDNDESYQAIGNVSNQFQGDYNRVLCVCSGGLLRSPTAAWVLSQAPYEYNTRSAGTNPDYALNTVSYALCAWAHQIICMENSHANWIKKNVPELYWLGKIQVLNIPDIYRYRDPELVKLIKDNYSHPMATE